MNFTSVLEELDRLYDEVETEVEITEEVNTEVETEEAEPTTELKEDVAEEAPIEEAEAEVVVDEPKQLILECDKCGALIIKDEADIKIDEESDLANIDEACAFCEETTGYKVIGVVAPYEVTAEDEEEIVIEDDEVIEEGIFNKDKTPKTIRAYKSGDPAFATKIAKELQTKFGGEVKPIALGANKTEDAWVDTSNKYKAANKYINSKYPNEDFSFNEYSDIVK